MFPSKYYKRLTLLSTNILFEGLSALYQYRVAVLIYFVVVFGAGYLLLRCIQNLEISTNILILTSLCAGNAVLCVISYAIVALSRFLPFILRPGGFLVFFIAAFVLLRGFWQDEIKIVINVRVAVGITAISLLLLLRFAFLTHIILPPYSDSPVHYQIIYGFLHPENEGNSQLSLETIFNNYYHFGFHSLAAWLVSIVGLKPENAISLLGQIFLVVSPLSMVVLTYTITMDKGGAVFAGLLAAIGWTMPAFAVNWGKFPAISSLAVAPSVVAVFVLWARSGFIKPKSWFWIFVLPIGITLLHTRILVCILLALACALLITKVPVRDRLGAFQAIRYSLLYLISLWLLSKYLVNYYDATLLMITFLVLLPFAFYMYPKLAIGTLLYTLGLWTVAVVPSLWNITSRPLLDQQFLEMMLYIPLSLLSGAGFAGLLNVLSETKVVKWTVSIAIMGCVLINFGSNHSMYPDPCCSYFQDDDRLAFEWLREKTSDHMLILISAFDNNGQMIGTDAGVWLFPFLGQPVNKLPFDINWNSPAEMGEICSLGAKDIYIYMGGRAYSFDDEQLARERRVRSVFEAGNTVIYQVSECQN